MKTRLNAIRRRLVAGRLVQTRIEQGPLQQAWQPVARRAHRLLFMLHRTIRGSFGEVARLGWWTPIFRAQLETPAPGLRLEHGMPQVEGPLRLRLGHDVRLSGTLILRGRSSPGAPPLLEIGDHVAIGRDSVIAVGTLVRIGNNTKLAGRNLLAGYSGHPMNGTLRSVGVNAGLERNRDIHLGEDVWLGSGVIVLAGVTIGSGTVVGAGSVVTRNLPARVLAGGNPARVLRNLGAVNDP